MLTQICQYLRNWFDRYEPKLVGTFVIDSENGITYKGADVSSYLKTGQYIRIIGSTFNDGVHILGSAELTPEEFDGAIWGMAIPKVLIDLAEEIDAWNTKYKDAQNSPYSSESFAGYSYTKASGNGNNGGSGASGATWQDVFGSRLAPWRKI